MVHMKRMADQPIFDLKGTARKHIKHLSPRLDSVEPMPRPDVLK
jgi:hypothetical protein